MKPITFFETDIKRSIKENKNKNLPVSGDAGGRILSENYFAFKRLVKWLRIQAEAVEDGRIEAQKHMLAGYPELQEMYKPGDGNTQNS